MPDTKNSLSIRAYTKQLETHSHESYHQLVLPIHGNIAIEMPNFAGKVTVGECVVIPAGIQHSFKADEMARFIVADLDILPEHFISGGLVVFSVTPPLLSYLHFVEKQLQHQVDNGLESSMMNVFSILLEQQTHAKPVDPRVRDVQSHIIENIGENLSINELAKIACLSPTQFKKLFKQNVGVSTLQYIKVQRMEKAKALLTHTDLPVQLIAERVGYTDSSAFSRRFSIHFGLSPRELARQ
ncbi:AraC family transcriptional regulator [Photobacterium angustum]|uniref:AraC family transcriptional regulator n=1 Tax=Photobacterium angustum TaxID=661 RepID=A0ABX5GYB4_PHOAN|nr:AraC family transcriptional regulator [Photobacterium angustum]KJF93325.1 AraC family transcriptional regulator [Photobacterium angustum]KJG05569.1 AraC family transcriptional regulator [Photobacterium angustum]KJG40692.1 AraC family transcriptional regulator [Photobacterium angustum]PSV95404.1 AraC family transcriptional regulator [Photobacterium angustum]PSW80998.1 AraC family transcriptional regulator [Photobacterium angustum]